METKVDKAMSWPIGLIKVAPGIYAYIQAVGSAGISNAGLILGPDQALVVDALVTIPRTEEFLYQIRQVTNVPISHVLLTHHDPDHYLGLQALMPAQIISHAYCREQIRERGLGVIDMYTGHHPEFAEGLRGFRLCLPDQTFEDRVTFYLGDMEVQCFNLGLVHTRGDVFVYIPKEKVFFAGDVAFFKVTPLGWHGHIGNWIKTLNDILNMDIRTIVPGHGPIGGKAELAEMRDYLQLVYDGAKRCFDRGLPESEAVATIDVGAYRNWANPERVKFNVERSYQEFRGEVTLEE